MITSRSPVSSSARILILGTGPCGLGAAWRLRELGYYNFSLIEKETTIGGLARSFRDPNGFTWDIGAHVIHSHYRYFDTVFEQVMLGDYSIIERRSWIWLDGKYVPYPFQLNIRHLSPALCEKCLRGLEQAAQQPATEPSHFAEWISRTFGNGIAECFMLPYNRKVWSYPLDRMSYKWFADRVAVADVDRIKRNIQEKRDDVSWGPNHIFKFPKSGGTGEIWKRVGYTLRQNTHFLKEAVRISTTRKTVTFSDGTVERYDILFSTIPLDNLVRLVDDTTLPNPTGKLVASAVQVVGLGFRGTAPDVLKQKSWIYIPDPSVPFFRVTEFSSYAQANAPSGTWSLMLELSRPQGKRLPDAVAINTTEVAARCIGLIPPETEVVDRWIFNTDYGYPVPTLERDAYLTQVLPLLETHEIYSRGRFGAWKYEASNQDHTFMQGVEWVNHITVGDEELTLTDTNRVNLKKR